LTNKKWMHIPAPVAIEKHAVVQFSPHRLASCGFSAPHRTANQKKIVS